MSDKEKILKTLSSLLETGILTVNDVKKELATNLKFKKDSIVNKLNLVSREEFEILKNLKIIVALGKIAFDTCVKFYRENFDYNERVKFGHGSYFKLPNYVLLMGCYHPSQRNVNTGRINEKQMTQLFKKVKLLV